ncbi:MAG TPA: SCP2 sterol-binding domain-containing protein [Chthoniobacterales bacterium]|nr:SCP2 sterol-binding domain-containing protein [Chthoniobacterales bacterium]
MPEPRMMGVSRYCAVFCAAIILLPAAIRAAPNEPQNTTPQQVFDDMRHSFRPDKAKGLHAKYQWELTGPNGGEWWIDVEDGTYKMGRGKIDSPNVTFVTSDKDWVAMSNGTLKGTWAFMTGRLKVRGSQALARKLDDIFP